MLIVRYNVVMSERIFANAVVVGLGSIGKKHADLLATLANTIFIIDPILKELTYAIPAKQLFSIRDLPASVNSNDVAVVSNWGPDHFLTVVALVQLGYRNIVLEKPLVCSLRELEDLHNLIVGSTIRVVVNQGWHYEKLGNRIRTLAQELSLGEPCAIWVTGGARCLSTAGTHYIQLAKDILLSTPIEVTSQLDFDRINPRSKQLDYVEGVVAILFEDRKRVSISYTNYSSIEGDFEILWKDAIGLLNGTELRIYQRGAERPYANIITRYGKAENLIFDNEVPNYSQSSHSGIAELYLGLVNDSSSELLNQFLSHEMTTKILLYSLLSNLEKRTLRVDDKVNKALYEKKFDIS